MTLERNLDTIKIFATNHQTNNDLFVEHLRTLDETELDNLVFNLNEKITPQIDCLQCGNCCKTLMINVEENEAERVAGHLEMSRNDFNNEYLEISEGGRILINTIPCKFLQSNNACKIYEQRFDGCKEFPALHLPQIQKRLFTLFMHYERCPIIFNVIEHLKKEIGFEG